ncbi:GHKL domain-containing protein [Natronorubrum sp. JWXQ-INN-674]|uniref:histidine kinase n=1 Tax=Natronorubrum halalkaliphilum TaxID=2691917 RepID=A0A6B0VM55_9EURY|nr:HAMP domain-containing sensor histidine kinase [Natronorubrum halalkaliphilum]MXV62921.1 GHKL domain-containing protein [Natronorubrum halalkaliphilum]
MHWPVGGSIASKDGIPLSVIGVGAVLTVVLLAELVLFVAFGPTRVPDGTFLVGAATTIPFLAGIIYGGIWLRSSDLSPARYPRIVWWCLVISSNVLLIALVLIVVVPTDSWAVVFFWTRWAVALGVGVGLLVGCIEGRAIERALTAERAVIEAEYVEEQRDSLDYLNSILRHEVLNTATIINGYASLLANEAPELNDQSRRWAEIVIEESEEMSTVVDDVRVLLETTEGEYRLEPTNVSDVLHDEIRKVDHKWGPVDVETSIPPDVYVQADALLARVFGNLLSNAVEHNDSATPQVAVTVDPGPETVRIEIADDGPGIPDGELDTLFERVKRRGSTHGLGLYLIDQLVARYDGAIELTETGPDGTVFTVELLATSADQEGEKYDAAAGSALVME